MTSRTSTPNQLESPGTAEAIRTARKFWWWVLGVSAAISVLGNALHAWIRVEHISDPTVPMLDPWVAALLAAVVPVAVLVHTHGLALIVQVPLKHGKLAKAVVFAVILVLAIGSFYLSWDALRELAMQAGFGADEAQLFPLLLDGSIGGATVVLLALPPTPRATGERQVPDATLVGADADHELAAGISGEVSSFTHEGVVTPFSDSSDTAAPHAADAPAEAVDQEQQSDPILAADTYRTEFTEAGAQPPRRDASILVATAAAPYNSTVPTALDTIEAPELDPEPEIEAGDAAKWSTVATRLCSGPVGHDPEEVAEILHLAFDQQRDCGDIAVRIGWKERNVRRLIDDAQPHRLVALAS
ncbi:DUF2637 domain-containing protein [Nocardia asteroides]|uniref:DUF2637 domain-containing protein n=1 Tax=Nocardia asteroides TaxID=1824 RepID=UPI001E36E005|nr:DUF2637 domain-containing protein [Nocardia asteroides]UGT58915.1 DUF2637 domain-containing protein [Nocardia asteroides]